MPTSTLDDHHQPLCHSGPLDRKSFRDVHRLNELHYSDWHSKISIRLRHVFAPVKGSKQRLQAVVPVPSVPAGPTSVSGPRKLQGLTSESASRRRAAPHQLRQYFLGVLLPPTCHYRCLSFPIALPLRRNSNPSSWQRNNSSHSASWGTTTTPTRRLAT